MAPTAHQTVHQDTHQTPSLSSQWRLVVSLLPSRIYPIVWYGGVAGLGLIGTPGNADWSAEGN